MVCSFCCLFASEAEGAVALANVVNLLLHMEYDSEFTIEATKKMDAKDLGNLKEHVQEAGAGVFWASHERIRLLATRHVRTQFL